MTRFLNELRHRRVLRAAAPYALISAGLVEVTDIVVGPLGLPEGLLVGVIIFALAGFPLVMVLAWFFDLTPEGLVRGTPPPESDRVQRRGLPLRSGDFEGLDRLAGARAEQIIDVPGMPGTAVYLQRLAKAAAAWLAVGDVERARELMRLAIPRPGDLDPSPTTIHALAIRARAESASGESDSAGRLFAAVRRNQALEYLREAIAAGWRDPTFADHDPALAEVRANLEYRAALDQI